AAKISCAVEAALLGHNMAMSERVFQPGEGLVMKELEETIRSIGHMGRVGMAQTDIEILNIMIDKTTI
ncbi:MAG: L-serine ammonia-lyase, iron-sulfur-dependent, subunit alpha, partial [Firmicutes bacterium]|nr:L-serine ammonia-lyase, iron-sulfur-dependent, subunit alpha [Bacillota bacterium]